MPYNSRAQDAAQEIKLAQAAVEKADQAFRKGGSIDALNAANRRLADAHQDLYAANSGTLPTR